MNPVFLEVNPVPDLWAYFTSFPVWLAYASIAVVLGINSFTFLLIFAWRGDKLVMGKRWMAAPLAIYGFAWLFQVLAGIPGNPVAGALWVTFTLFILASLIWSLVNFVRVLINR